MTISVPAMLASAQSLRSMTSNASASNSADTVRAINDLANRLESGGTATTAEMGAYGDTPQMHVVTPEYMQSILSAFRSSGESPEPTSSSSTTPSHVQTNAAYFTNVATLDKAQLSDAIDMISDMMKSGQFKGVDFHGANGDQQTSSAQVYLGWLTTAVKSQEPPAQLYSGNA